MNKALIYLSDSSSVSKILIKKALKNLEVFYDETDSADEAKLLMAMQAIPYNLIITDLFDVEERELSFLEMVEFKGIKVIGILPETNSSSMDMAFSSMILRTKMILRHDFKFIELNNYLYEIFSASLKIKK